MPWSRKEYRRKNKTRLVKQAHEYYLINKERLSEKARLRRANNLDEARRRQKESYMNHRIDRIKHQIEYQKRNRELIAKRNERYYLKLKTEVLSHYGPNGVVQCSWEDCDISDMDMLTLDHINNDGADDRRVKRGGRIFYARLRKNGYPDGLRTLCHNHQWKKEMTRRREGRTL
jgi:hypothetical protein